MNDNDNEQMPVQQEKQMPVHQIDGYERMPIDMVNDPGFLKDKMPKKLRKFMEMDNIAEALDEEELQQIAELCLTGYDIDKESRAEWEEVMKHAFKLVGHNLEIKNSPWEGAANIKYPLITSSCIQFNARTNPEIIKNDRVVEIRTVRPNDPEGAEKAYRLSAFMSYQLLGQSDHWQRDTDKLLMMLPMMGTVFRKSFFNPLIGQPDTVLCMPDDVVINQKIPTLERAQRISHLIYLSSNELIEGVRAGIYLDHDLKELSASVVNYKDSISEEKSSSVDATIPQTYSEDADDKNVKVIADVIHEVVEQHRWLDLDGDEYQEPYIVTVHKSSRKVLRIKARYDERCFEYNVKGEFTKINPLHYFTDFHFIPDPTGNYYSLGFGRLLLEANETVNTLINQLLDAGTLSNRQCGFIGGDLRLPSGDLLFKPGEWKKINSTSGEVISKNIVPLPLKEPSATLFQLMQFLIESTRQITSVTDIMAGQTPPLNQPATTTMAMMEQSQQVYSGILYRIYESLKKEFQKLYDLDKKYLKDIEHFPFAEHIGIISRKDFEEDNYGVFPVADPRISSSFQRMAQGQALLELTKFPQINPIPVLLNYLQLLRVSSPKQFIAQPPPPSPEALLAEANVKLVEMQTAGILMEKELKAIELGIKEFSEKSKALNFAGKLSTDKVDSAVKIAQVLTVSPPEKMNQALSTEESLAQNSQVQNYPAEEQQDINSMQDLIGQLLLTQQQKLMPPPQAPQMGAEGMAKGAIPIPQIPGMPAQENSPMAASPQAIEQIAAE